MTPPVKWREVRGAVATNHLWFIEIEPSAPFGTLVDAGIDPATFDATMAVLIYSFWPDYADHLATIVAENGLTVVSRPETV